MEPVEPIRKNASQRKNCRKRVVTKNELKRILTSYTSQLPCVVEACKVEKRELNLLVKSLQEEVRAKDASIKVLRENLAVIRCAIREFSCFIASNYPGTSIATAAQAWEKRWKAEDEEGLWNNASSSKMQSAVHHHQSHAKPVASSVTNTSTASTTQPEKAQFISSQQNNIFHEFARKSALAISRRTNSNVSRKSPANFGRIVSPSLSAVTDNNNCPTPAVTQTQSTATAHALITVNHPLNLPMSSDASSDILVSASSQYKIMQTNNSSPVNGQASSLGLNSADTKRKSRNGSVNTKKVQKSEIVNDVIVLSDDEGEGKVDVEDMVTIPRYDSINLQHCKKSHPLVYPKLRIYPGLRISRLHITWLNSYEVENPLQIFHILYYIRSMVEKEEAEGWAKIYSKECEAGGNSRLRIQFDEGQTWFNDAVYFTGFIECGLERYGAYADVCKVELGLQDRQIPTNFTRRYWP